MSVPDIGVIAGSSNTGLQNANLLVRAVDPVMHYYKFNEHPLISKILTLGTSLAKRENSPAPSMSGKSLKKKSYGNPKVEWFENDLLKNDFSTTAAVAASDTSLTVSSSDDDYFVAGDVLHLTNANGQTENVIISSVAANTLNVTNVDGTTRTVGITMTTGDKFYRGANARAESSTAPSIRSSKAAEMYNYMQYFSRAYGMSLIEKNTVHYGTSNPMAENRRQAYSDLLQDIEIALLTGTRAIAGSTSNPVRHAGGLKYFMELYSNVTIKDLNGYATTRAEVDSFLSDVCKAGSPDKVALCDNRMLNAISGMGYENVQVDNYRVSEFGQRIKKIFGPQGEIELVHEPLFDKVAVYRGSMMVIDLNDTEWCHLPNLDFYDKPQMLSDGSSDEKGTYEGVGCLKIATLKHSGWMKNASV